MANVLFKRGQQASLPAIGSATDGVFYLTTDTHRLYVGQGTTPVLLNQTVQFVKNIAELTSISSGWTTDAMKEAHLQDLYYVLPGGGNGTNTHNGNILAVWCKDTTNNTYSWVQINPDHNTFVTDMQQHVIAGTANDVTVRTSLTQNDGNDAKLISFKVTGSGKTIDVDGADGNITLTGDTYTLSRPAKGEIRLNSALGQNATSIKLIEDENITIANGTNANEIKIKAHDTKNSSAVLSLDANGKLTVKVNDTNGDNVNASTGNITMKYGVGGALNAPIGQTMNVYSMSEIDAKFRDLNGLTYVGTVGPNGGNGIYAMGTDFKIYNGTTAINVHNGDMFLVAGDIKYGTDKNAKAGDLLIATGTETNGVLSAITWTYVPSGDDVKLDTTYNFNGNASDNSMTIKTISSIDGDMGVAGKMSFTAGTATTVSSVVSGNTSDKNEILAVTIGHADVACNKTAKGTAVDLSSTAKTNVITGVEVNSQGHVTKITTTEVSATRYKLSAAPSLSASTAGTLKAVTIKQGLVLGADDPVYQTTGFKLQSNSLSITKTNDNNIQVDYVWGEF